MYIIHTSSLSSFAACFRNIISCILIYFCALKLGNKIDIDLFFGIIKGILLLVIVFGIVEYVVGLNIWGSLNIKQLWPLKGIAVNNIGFPKNWWSSERIAGKQLRRMVSSFTDPVNLGTFLFSAFVVMWYKKIKY